MRTMKIELTSENAAALVKYAALAGLSGSFCKQARATESPRLAKATTVFD
jgi:hypothetical protein